MSALGPALAEALGGVWHEQRGTVHVASSGSAAIIRADLYGRVWLDHGHGPLVRLGSHSDGVEALAEAARDAGVGA